MVSINEEFDDAIVYRRKIEYLEQKIGDMGLQIGVLKQERAHLYLCLRAMLDCYLETGEWNTVILKAQAILNEIKIS